MAAASSGSAAALSSSASWSGWRKSAFSSRVTLPSSARTRPSATLASGLTSTRSASSATKVVPQLHQDVGDLVGDLGRELRRRRRSRGPSPRRRPRWRRSGSWRAASGFFSATSSISMPPCDGGDGEEGAVGAVEQVGEVVLLGDVRRVSASITLWTVWPLMSMPRMSVARATASSGSAASLTPPALPRPPTFTCALTTDLPPSRSATARAASGVSTTSPASTGTPCLAKRSLAWYSNRSTRVRPFSVIIAVRCLRGRAAKGNVTCAVTREAHTVSEHAACPSRRLSPRPWVPKSQITPER